MDYNNSIKSSTYGFVIGDAIGVPIEFTPRQYEEYKKLKEMVGYGSHSVPEGTWSDDTSMTIATMDSIQEKKGIDYNDIMDKFLLWLERAYYTATNVVFDIGITTSNALKKYRYSSDPMNCGEKQERSNGNGSLMRMMPIAYYLIANNISSDDEFKLIKNISSLTHAHEISVLGCYIYIQFLKELILGIDKTKAFNNICSIDYNKYFSKETIKVYNRLLSNDFKNVSRDDIRSSGYVVHSLESSIWCTLNNDNFEDAIVDAINLGSDTDTIGAITGSLVGTIYGYSNIPDRWISKLRKKDYLDSIIEKYSSYLSNAVINKNDESVIIRK